MYFLTLILLIATGVNDSLADSSPSTPTQTVKPRATDLPPLSLYSAGKDYIGLADRQAGSDYLERRDLVICPEDAGAQALPCSAPVCGGEDPNSKGFCKNKNSAGGNCHCEFLVLRSECPN